VSMPATTNPIVARSSHPRLQAIMTQMGDAALDVLGESGDLCRVCKTLVFNRPVREDRISSWRWFLGLGSRHLPARRHGRRPL
jgi:hypothetical protein